ncbi:hypothetical protein OsJ_15945 [Oryza sativa Japonica Group]|uniref:Uncharacterized protein n=1 Tax=Oryza sativa subsp. japonica TaxID=39947 RepID=B9FC67_ORYSJ|nr:hypothetical protein OsJ_15945 [Oryza sativa Japonica Group]
MAHYWRWEGSRVHANITGRMRRLSSGSRGASSSADGSASAAISSRNRTRSSSSQQPTDPVQEEEQEDDEFWFCGPTRVPPRPTREEDKPVLRPIGDMQWEVQDYGQSTRVPNGILTTLIKENFPGVVKFKGRDEPAWSPEHYLLKPDNAKANQARLPSLLHRVEEEFWGFYRWAEGTEVEARRVVHNCVKKLFVDIFYEARILAVITYHKKILKTDIDRPTACRTYLTKAEYMKAKPWWFLNAGRAWALLSDLRWCNPEWQAYSRACSERRAKMKTPAHRQGSANLHRYHKNLEKKMGTPVHVLKAYAHANRVDPDEGYCDEDSSQNMLLEAYARAFTERHGEDSNWRTEPIDGVAVHMAGGGKKHGRFFLLNGLLKTPDVLADVGRSRCSLDDPRPSRRLRPNPDDSARIEELERQLQCEREEREQERERAREEREQERERAREERERALEEMERTRKEMEQEREQARVERVREHELFQEKTSYFTCALEVLQRKLNINFLPPCTPTLTHPATSGSEVSIGNPVTTTE